MPSINDNLKVLQRQFADALPGRLEALRSQYQKLDPAGWQPVDGQGLYHQLHSLTGSAGTFGLQSVSVAARQLESQVKAILDSGGVPDENAWAAIGEELVRIEQLALSRLRADAASLMPPGPVPRFNRTPLIDLVDDDPEQAHYLAQTLRKNGFKVRVFTALEDFRAAWARTETELPDAMVLDMSFPEGDSAGAALLAEIKTERERCPPVVFVSVRDDLEARLTAYRAGAARYLLKPVVPTALIDLLDELTGRIPPEPYRVLLVDDDPLLLEVQATVLRAAGMTVQALTQPKDTLDTLDAFRPDVVVLDVYMPEVSGPELAAIVRERDDYLSLPILFLSAETDMSRQLLALNLGGDDFLVKPVRAEHLVSAVTARARRARQNGAVQRRLQTTLYEREREHLALEHHAIVSIADARGDIIYVNDYFCRISGYGSEELLGQNHRIVKSGVHPSGFYQDMWRTVIRGDVWKGEICNQRKDGSLYWVETSITPFLDENNRPYQYVSIRTDITHVKVAEELQRTQNAMRAVVNEAAAKLLAAGAETLDAVIEQSLRRAGEHLGVDRAYLFLVSEGGAHISNSHEWCAPGIASQKDDLQEIPLVTFPLWWTRILRDQPVVIPDVAALPSESAAEQAMFESLDIRALCGFPIRHSGEIQGFIGFDQVHATRDWDETVLDLLALLAGLIGSARSRMAGELAMVAAREEADRASRAKSEFLSSMSHELRTPMNAILGFGQLMEYDDTLPDEHQDNVREIIGAGRHLLELINEVLDLAKVESGKIDMSMESIELCPVIEECLLLVGTLANRRSIRLQHRCIQGAVVRADRTRLKQALLNLLSNAIKYNREGGSVTLDVQVAGEDRVRLRVTDTGYGIPGDRLAELFLPFNRLDAGNTEVEGTGIGLTITRRVVDMMGGTVDVESEVGAGSTFWIELPLERLSDSGEFHEVPRSTGKPGHGAATGVDHTVLYVEDNPSNIKLVAQLLGRVPQIQLLTAHTPELGIELALAHQPDLILLDINMPGMDGYQVLKVFQAEASLKDTPMIAITANAMPLDIERGMAAGFVDYLTKPLDVPRFLDTVQRYLAGEMS